MGRIFQNQYHLKFDACCLAEETLSISSSLPSLRKVPILRVTGKKQTKNGTAAAGGLEVDEFFSIRLGFLREIF